MPHGNRTSIASLEPSACGSRRTKPAAFDAGCASFADGVAGFVASADREADSFASVGDNGVFEAWLGAPPAGSAC